MQTKQVLELSEYEKHKFEVADIVRTTKALIGNSDSVAAGECAELMKNLAEDRFRVAVIGRFSRGKTSLMNAILGDRWLPTGIVPLTSVITTVTYGSAPRALVQNTTGGLRYEISLNELPEYVTQEKNPGNCKHVREVEVQLPSEILRRGFYFVDTPGLGSSIAENTRTTMEFLPQVDVVLLVSSFEGVLSEEEFQVLERLSLTSSRLYLVVNKSDLVSEPQRDEVLGFVQQQIQQMHGGESPRVFTVSAEQALEAKARHDPELLQRSEIMVLEEDLIRFLTEEKNSLILARNGERLLQILDRQPQATNTAELRTRTQRLLSSITLGSSGTVHSAISTDNILTIAPRRTGVVCEVCHGVLHRVLDFLAGYQYKLSFDAATREAHAERGGFCCFHTWQYETLASARGVCSAYPATLQRISDAVNELSRDGTLGRQASARLRQYLSPQCPACELCAEATEEICMRLAATISETAPVPGICTRHLPALLQYMDSPAVATKLLQSVSATLKRTSEDMQRCGLKQDALRRDLISEEERKSPEVALALIAGHKQLIQTCEVR